ncbi:hypothetical protein, partial [Rhodococcus sp. NPDC060176]|uniref:hypothetical protein n=1 Tax=Rhodococcus sp. NPDC060176 TaxID=3347062 RepID=UPI00364B1732
MNDTAITPSPHGRWEYVPVGGHVLAAEQVENVRAAREALRGYRNFDVYARSHVNRLIEAVGALFPATEPAEVNGNICAEGNSSPTVVHVHHH